MQIHDHPVVGPVNRASHERAFVSRIETKIELKTHKGSFHPLQPKWLRCRLFSRITT